MADSAPVNPSVAHKMEHSKHISCNNYNLNLEGKLMIEENVELKHIADKIDLTSAAVRGSCKISTALRNETALDNPKVWNLRAKGKFVTRAYYSQPSSATFKILCKTDE